MMTSSKAISLLASSMQQRFKSSWNCSDIVLHKASVDGTLLLPQSLHQLRLKIFSRRSSEMLTEVSHSDGALLVVRQQPVFVQTAVLSYPILLELVILSQTADCVLNRFQATQ